MTSLSKHILHTLLLSAAVILILSGTPALAASEAAVSESVITDKELTSLLTSQNQLQYISRTGLSIIVLLLYATVSIPLIFYCFRKKRLKAHLRLLLTSNALFFTAVIILLALPTRHDKPFLSCIWMDAYTGTQQTSFSLNSIQSPYGGSFSLETDDAWEITFVEPKQDVAVSETDSAIRLEFTNQAAFHPVCFLMEQTKACSDMPVTAELSYFHGRLFGTITNHSGYDLEDTVFVYHDWLIPIYTLKQGETIWISQYEMYTTHDNTCWEQIYHMLQNKDVYQQQAIQMEKLADIYMLLFNHLKETSADQGILLGHTSQTPDILTKEWGSYDTDCTHFTGVHLNVNSPQ